MYFLIILHFKLSVTKDFFLIWSFKKHVLLVNKSKKNISSKKNPEWFDSKTCDSICLKKDFEINQGKLMFIKKYCFLTPFLTKCSELDIIKFWLKLTSATLAFHSINVIERPCEFLLSLERVLLLIPSHSHQHWWGSRNPRNINVASSRTLQEVKKSFLQQFLWKSSF